MKLLIDNWLLKEIPEKLNLQRKIHLKKEIVKDPFFDLTDDKTLNVNIVLEKGLGKASYSNQKQKELCIVDFEDYKKQLSNSATLQKYKLTRQCDYLIVDTSHTICLNEITSGKSFQMLLKEIKKDDTVEFSGGKFEKVQQQLLHSLKTLLLSDKIAKKLSFFEEKICLCSYKINISEMKPAQIAFNRALIAETDISNNRGIQYSHKEIENLGFQYRRIGYIPFKIS